jgi:hypothetical protein
MMNDACRVYKLILAVVQGAEQSRFMQQSPMPIQGRPHSVALSDETISQPFYATFWAADNN